MQTNLELKLQELYGGYEKLDNGSYYIKLENGSELFIPSSISQNQSMIAYAPGSGGSGNSARNIRNIYNSDNPPSCVTVIAPTSPDYNNILNIGTDAINNLGGQVNNIVYASFSASGLTGLKKSEEYLKQNPNVSMSIISCDGCATYTALKDEYPTIKETETPFIILSGGLKYKSYYQKMYDSGYNAYFLKVTNSQKYEHSQLNKDMIDYLLRYAVGEQDEIPENENGYILYKGNFENGVDIENIRCASAGNLAGYDKNKYKSILKLNALSFTGLDNYKDNDKIGNGYVKADFNYLSTTLNQIRSTISKANIATKTPSLPISGANGLLSAITTCIDKYSTMTVSLYSKLAQETQATQSYGQSIINLDIQQKGQLENINDGVVVNTNDNAGSLSENTNTNTNTSTNTNTRTETTTTTNIVTETNTNTKTNTNTSTNTNTNTNNSNSSNPNTNINTGASVGAGVSAGVSSGTNTTNPIINGNHMTWKYADGHNLTLTLENGTVTGMKFTYNYSSYDELNKNINNILVGQIDKQYFDKMTIIDKTVEVTIKPNYFKELPLTKIKEMFFK